MRFETRSTSAPRPGAADEAEVTEFVRRHQAGLWRFVRSLGAAASVADEVTQDALLVALERRTPLALPGAEAAAFLRQAARFLWLRRTRDELRARRRLAEAAELLWRRHAAQDDGAGWLEALDSCLARLAPSARALLERFYREGASRAELAVELGLSEHGVRTQLQRIRAKLKECIEWRRETAR